MKAAKVIDNYIMEHGITLSHIARSTGIHAEKLRRSLRGTRTLPADEFLLIVRTLSLDLSTFIPDE